MLSVVPKLSFQSLYEILFSSVLPMETLDGRMVYPGVPDAQKCIAEVLSLASKDADSLSPPAEDEDLGASQETPDQAASGTPPTNQPVTSPGSQPGTPSAEPSTDQPGSPPDSQSNIASGTPSVDQPTSPPQSQSGAVSGEPPTNKPTSSPSLAPNTPLGSPSTSEPAAPAGPHPDTPADAPSADQLGQPPESDKTAGLGRPDGAPSSGVPSQTPGQTDDASPEKLPQVPDPGTQLPKPEPPLPDGAEEVNQASAAEAEEVPLWLFILAVVSVLSFVGSSILVCGKSHLGFSWESLR